MLSILAYFSIAGVFVGLLAGMLGGGGGVILVPVLVYGLAWQGVGEHAHHLALGTSMATMVLTTLVTTVAQHRKGAVRWSVVARFMPGVLAGTFLGSAIVAATPARPLTALFILFLLFMAWSMARKAEPKPGGHLPGSAMLAASGALIGGFSSFVGIGGGMLTVPFLLFCSVPLREAIGTSAAVTFCVSLSGSLGYMLAGAAASGLPSHAVGFVYLPAFLCLTLASILCAPLGVRIAYRTPVLLLKRLFALFIFCVALKMAHSFLLP